MAVDPFHAQPVHKLRVARRHVHAVHFCSDAVPADLLNIRHAAAVDLFPVCALEAFADGMGGGTLCQRRVFQQLLSVHFVVVDFINFKHTLGQCAGLVKYDIFRLRQDLQIVGTLHKHAGIAGAANPREEA